MCIRDRLNTGTIDIMPDSISVGAESNVMFQINNTGKVLLYNVMVTFLGDSVQKTDAYVGNIKPGDSGSVDAMLSGIAPTAVSYTHLDVYKRQGRGGLPVFEGQAAGRRYHTPLRTRLCQ